MRSAKRMTQKVIVVIILINTINMMILDYNILEFFKYFYLSNLFQSYYSAMALQHKINISLLLASVISIYC